MKNMGREDLADRYSYFKYQRLIRYYTECINEKKREYARRLIGIIKEEKEKIKKIIKKEYVSRYYRVYLPLFLMSPKLAYYFGGLFEKFVRLRSSVYTLRKSGG